MTANSYNMYYFQLKVKTFGMRLIRDQECLFLFFLLPALEVDFTFSSLRSDQVFRILSQDRYMITRLRVIPEALQFCHE